MSRLLIALFVSAGLGLAGSAAAQMHSPMATPMTAPLSKDGYTQAKQSADAQYRLDKDACASLSGNARDICVAEAKGKDSVAQADAEAAYLNTPKARESARVALAQANYDVATEKCDDSAGNRKDVCVKEAKAALVRGKANAKVDRVAADTRLDAMEKQTEARTEASASKRDADYAVAIERCDVLAGAAKDGCVANAKVQFGKS